MASVFGPSYTTGQIGCVGNGRTICIISRFSFLFRRDRKKIGGNGDGANKGDEDDEGGVVLDAGKEGSKKEASLASLAGGGLLLKLLFRYVGGSLTGSILLALFQQLLFLFAICLFHPVPPIPQPVSSSYARWWAAACFWASFSRLWDGGAILPHALVRTVIPFFDRALLPLAVI